MVGKRLTVLFAAVITAGSLASGVATAESNADGNSVSVARSADGRTMSTADAQRATLEFWTPERMKASIPADLPADTVKSTRKAAPTGPAGEIKPVEATVKPQDVAAHDIGIQATYASRAMGKVFFRKPNDTRLWHCSGASIGSTKRRLVLTAGHCLHTGKGGGWATEFVFVPYYFDGSRPHGSFVATYLSSKNGWINNSDFAYDMGIAVTANNEFGRRVNDEVGGNGTRWNYPRDVNITMMGYPLDRNNGERPWLCWGKTERVGVFDGRIQIRCGFTGGASGGPWLQDYNDRSDGWGVGYANGVTSTVNSDNWNRSPYFDDNFKSLYDFAESHSA